RRRLAESSPIRDRNHRSATESFETHRGLVEDRGELARVDASPAPPLARGASKDDLAGGFARQRVLAVTVIDTIEERIVAGSSHLAEVLSSALPRVVAESQPAREFPRRERPTDERGQVDHWIGDADDMAKEAIPHILGTEDSRKDGRIAIRRRVLDERFENGTFEACGIDSRRPKEPPECADDVERVDLAPCEPSAHVVSELRLRERRQKDDALAALLALVKDLAHLENARRERDLPFHSADLERFAIGPLGGIDRDDARR